MADAEKKESTPTMTMTDAELEKLLNREASELNREMECERVLKAFKLKYAFPFPYLSPYIFLSGRC